MLKRYLKILAESWKGMSDLKRVATYDKVVNEYPPYADPLLADRLANLCIAQPQMFVRLMEMNEAIIALGRKVAMAISLDEFREICCELNKGNQYTAQVLLRDALIRAGREDIWEQRQLLVRARLGIVQEYDPALSEAYRTFENTNYYLDR